MLNFNDSNFSKEVLDSKYPVLVDFFAEWCGPCKTMAPIFEELSKEYDGKPIKFGKMNVDESGVIPSQFGVMSIPTFIIFSNGKPVDQLMGVQSKDNLKKKIAELLK